MLESSPLEPVNMIFFGNRIFAGDQVRIKSLGWSLIQYDYILIKGEIWTHGMLREKMMCRFRKKTVTDKQRNTMYVSISVSY